MSTHILWFGSLIVLALAIGGFAGCSKSDTGTPAEEHHEGDGHEHEGEHFEGDGHDHSKDGAAHDDHDDTDHEHAHLTEAEILMPAEFPAAVARLKTCNESLQAAIKLGDVHKAHAPVDELVVLAGKLTSIARDSGVPKTHWKDINLLAKELDTQLDALHDALDRDETTGYDTIGPQIDAAIAQLSTFESNQLPSPHAAADPN
ncbi:MAG: hypothetical protein K1X74_06345 [Pirellulales bacterium]|nr:hypothetical protein [Pirellulales bacterium]